MWLCGGMAQMRLEVSWGRLGTPSLYYTGLLQPLLWGVREGDFGEGFPTQVQEEEHTSVSLESSVARPVRGCSSHPWVGNWACLCVPWFMFCSGRQLFPRKVTSQSLTWLIQGKRRFICTSVRKPECSRGRTRGYRAGAKGNSGQAPWPLLSGQSLWPALTLLSSPTAKAAGRSESWPNKLPLRGVSHPPRGAAGLELALSFPSGFLSGLLQSEGGGTGPCQAGQSWAGAQGGIGWWRSTQGRGSVRVWQG